MSKRLSSLSGSIATSLPSIPSGVSVPPSPTTPTSGRPAPPSPALSRRTSSRYSGSSSTTGPSKPSRLSTQLLPTIPPASATPTASTAGGSLRKYALIIIRDFAYLLFDDRHRGHGEHVPRANRPGVINLQEPLEDEGIATEPEDEGSSTGTGSGGGGFASRLSSSYSSNSDPSYPSRGDLDRNFGGDDDAQESPDEDEEDDGEGEDLLPGIYRAMYPFEPEGSAEMALEERQEVRVVGRGGGVGWAVVVDDKQKERGTVHALVPESYLEVVRLDGEESEEEAT